jgi:hypothetical protein
VHADDIARAVVACIATGAASARVLEIGGGERLPYHAMFRRVHASLAQPTLALPLPGAALRGLAAVLPRARGPVSRLQQDLIADNGRCRRCWTYIRGRSSRRGHVATDERGPGRAADRCASRQRLASHHIHPLGGSATIPGPCFREYVRCLTRHPDRPLPSALASRCAPTTVRATCRRSWTASSTRIFR